MNKLELLEGTTAAVKDARKVMTESWSVIDHYIAQFNLVRPEAQFDPNSPDRLKLIYALKLADEFDKAAG